MKGEQRGDSLKIQELEREVAHIRKEQAKLDQKVCHERLRAFRLSQQKAAEIVQLKRRLTEEGRRAHKLEAESGAPLTPRHCPELIEAPGTPRESTMTPR